MFFSLFIPFSRFFFVSLPQFPNYYGMMSLVCYIMPEWVWYLFAILAIVFVLVLFVLLYLSRRNLKSTNAMLETSYNILEMSNNELLEANQELIKANAKAEESSKMKTNFIQQISHEIRTPLNILSGFAQVITILKIM